MLDAKAGSAVAALARLGSFREAAAALGTSPASLSRHVARAEEHAGQALFERKRNGVAVTPAGREFLRLLEGLEAANSVFEQGVERLRATGSDILTIGCGPLTTRTLISPILARLLTEMPDLRVRVDVRATKEPLEALRSGGVDAAVCDLTHTPDLSDLDIQVVQRMPVSFWARSEHPIHARGTISLAELFREPLMTPHLHRHWRVGIAEVLGGDASAQRFVERLPQIESDDYGLLVDLACRTDMICGGMTDMFAERASVGALKMIRTHTSLYWNICGVRRKGNRFKALDRFWEELSEGFAQKAT